jgi:hypothetical protein
MIVKATATKGEYQKGVEYDLPNEIAQALIIQGTMSFVAISPAQNRQKAVQPEYEQRCNITHSNSEILTK